MALEVATQEYGLGLTIPFINLEPGILLPLSVGFSIKSLSSSGTVLKR
jgi:hypothetical protein